ncbi:hypothetical protein O3P69_007727 [Scylla paramamosain]|uniref:Uncharacterized protein n=1 Tax=Scylla paramamosain TaxID=85552 RepID=A0AAW0V061_SCYPA
MGQPDVRVEGSRTCTERDGDRNRRTARVISSDFGIWTARFRLCLYVACAIGSGGDDVEDVLPAPVCSLEELDDLSTKLADETFKSELEPEPERHKSLVASVISVSHMTIISYLLLINVVNVGEQGSQCQFYLTPKCH